MKMLSWLHKRKPVPPVQMAAPVRILSYRCAGIHGIGARERQEDAWAVVNAEDVTMIRNEGLLAVIADGIGGMQNGNIASSTAARVLEETFHNMDRTKPIAPQLTESVFQASEKVEEMLQCTGGTTVVACVLFDEKLYYTGVGDSSLYLMRDGQLLQINQEQNLQNKHYLEMIHLGNMDGADTSTVAQAKGITAFLGYPDLETVDSLKRAMPLEDGDVLLLCTDGVSGMLSKEEIKHCLSMPIASEAALALQRSVLAKENRYQDNYTAIVIQCIK